jgi:hypothetical protein
MEEINLEPREGRRRVTEPALNVGRPEKNGNREDQSQPEFVPEHGHGVSGVTVVGRLDV